MTVKELIDHLRLLPEDAQVVTPGTTGWLDLYPEDVRLSMERIGISRHDPKIKVVKIGDR